MRSVARIFVLVICGFPSLPKPRSKGKRTSHSQQQLEDSHEAYTQAHSVASITLISRRVRNFKLTLYLLLHQVSVMAS